MSLLNRKSYCLRLVNGGIRGGGGGGGNVLNFRVATNEQRGMAF